MKTLTEENDMAGYKYTIPNDERKRYHLVVSKETHRTIVHYSRRWGLSITTATQQILAKTIKELLVDGTSALNSS